MDVDHCKGDSAQAVEIEQALAVNINDEGLRIGFLRTELGR